MSSLESLTDRNAAVAELHRATPSPLALRPRPGQLPNGTPLLVTKGREAHWPNGAGPACRSRVGPLVLITLAQAAVYVSPIWCSKCFPAGSPWQTWRAAR